MLHLVGELGCVAESGSAVHFALCLSKVENPPFDRVDGERNCSPIFVLHCKRLKKKKYIIHFYENSGGTNDPFQSILNSVPQGIS